MAYTITVLSWGVIDYEDAYVKAGELENVHKAIKWATDYFIKVRFIRTLVYSKGYIYSISNNFSVTSKKENSMDKLETEM
jgi:hypothetical protein